MEIRFQRVFLTVWVLLSVFAFNSNAADESISNTDLKIKADIERRIVLDDVLDNENFEVGFQAGVIAIEDFESSAWLSGHFAYHITEFFYVKANYGKAKGGETSFEKLTNTAPLLTDEQREFTYYGLNIGYNLMPGEVFLGRDYAFNSLFSIELGAGSTEFAGDDNFTVNITANYRVFMTDYLAWDIGMTDYIFDTKVIGETKTTHNLNFTTGISFYF
ncbi:MAG: outer membrane beta-barrel domain-containing protein [Colwellia sp.]|nr:outer membrane beta-barrel domain-containing protein [Colwellia sp.]